MKFIAIKMSLFNNNDLIIEEAYQKALRLLDYAPQTEKILSIKLSKKGISQNIIVEVIKKLKENNLINDIDYAIVYAENLAKINYFGPNKIISKLKLKGIDKDNAIAIAKKIILSNGGEEVIIKKNIEKNILLIKRLLKNNQIEKIKRKLYNNGFSISIINKKTKQMT